MADSRTIDLNADLGESFGRWTLGDDAALLPVVTSANVACGFHAGDPRTLVETCRMAVEHGVAIGAQVGYRDLAGFGRRFVDVEPDDLYADVLYQLAALDGIARAAGGAVTYLKPHGALYHAVAVHEGQAQAVVQAAAGLTAVTEAFADRGYRADGSLVPRTEAGALVTDPTVVAARVVRLVVDGRLAAQDGTEVLVDAQSVCLHGDSPGAVAMATAVRAALDDAGVTVTAFAPLAVGPTERDPGPPA